MENLPEDEIEKTQLSSLQFLYERMKLITRESMTRSGAKINPVANGERTLGTVHDEDTKRLYCLAEKLQSEACILQHKAEDCDLSDEEQKHLLAQGHRLGNYADLAKEIWWTQVREEMGYFDGDIGIRKDFMAVATKSNELPDMPPILKKIFGLSK